MNPDTLRQLLDQIPDENRAWWLNGLVTGLAAILDPDAQERVIDGIINPVLSADEANALEAISYTLIESPPIRSRQ